MADVDVIVPVLNEAEALPRFFERVRRTGVDMNLVFVDNASTDDSVSIIRSFPGVQLIEHEKNEGYGGSLINGMRRTSASQIVIIDADCEYPPECIPGLLAALQEHDVVYASRLLNKADASEAGMNPVKMFGNKLISMLFNVLFKQNTTDLYTGCKALRRECIQGMTFQRKGFEHVLELAVRLSNRGYMIHDYPVRFEQRATGKAKMKHVSETTKFLWLIMAFYLRTKTRGM
ncbi:glycosyltransferase family 2 protein [Desulfonatronum parangueonense]